MRATIPKEIIKCRVTEGNDLLDNTAIPVGAFNIKHKQHGDLLIISSIGLGWDHVSVSIVTEKRKKKIPSWSCMCYVKDLFFEPDETVIQFHPPKSRYVNFHPGVLHLWRPQRQSITLPPIECV